MAKFIYNDFVTDDIPECPLSNSQLVKQAASRLLQDDVEIIDVQLYGIVYENEVLHEWFIQTVVKNVHQTLRLPLYLPRDEKQAARQIALHSQITSLSDLPTVPYEPDDYLLVGYKYPCQLKLDAHNNLCLKRIEMFASQKMVQDFMMATMGCEIATAAMIIINMHTLCCKDLHDIGWLINMDGMPSITALDRRYANSGLTFIDGFDELPIDAVFGINNQKYIVAEDPENGQFIAKFSGKDHIQHGPQ